MQPPEENSKGTEAAGARKEAEEGEISGEVPDSAWSFVLLGVYPTWDTAGLQHSRTSMSLATGHSAGQGGHKISRYFPFSLLGRGL